MCDILSPENVFGGNKTVNVYRSRQKEVVVSFQAGQRSAGVPYRTTSSTEFVPSAVSFDCLDRSYVTLFIVTYVVCVNQFCGKKF